MLIRSGVNWQAAFAIVPGAAAVALLMVACGQPAAIGLQQKHGCTGCHADERKLVGPAFDDIAARYRGKDGAEAALIAKVRSGGSGVWGPLPMPPNAAVPDADLKAMIKTILARPAR